MLDLKKLVISILSLSSVSTFAGTMGPMCSSEHVTTPCQQSGWSVGGRALYIQPGTGFSGTEIFEDFSGTSSIDIGNQPTWGWGFQLEADYRYSTGNDFNLNWYHYRMNQFSNLSGSVSLNNVIFRDPLAIGSPLSNSVVNYDNVTFNNLNVNVSLAWDQVNMEFGKHINLSEADFIRLHGGLNFSRIAGIVGYQFEGSTTSSSNEQTNYNNSLSLNSSFNGLGARFGMDLNHTLMKHLDIYANGAVSLLAGSNTSSHNGTDVINNVAYADQISSHANLVGQELDARIGGNYAYELTQGCLNFNAGWLWASYFNTMTHHATNYFNVQGVYFGLKWDGELV